MKNASCQANRCRKRAFTLVELMVVVVLISLLTFLAIPSFIRIHENVKGARFAQDAQALSAGFQTYALENAGFPPRESEGTMPPGLEEYLPSIDWSKPTPIGGKWQWIHDAHGVNAAIAARHPDLGNEVLERIDTRIDDGSVHAGRYRFISGTRYARVIEE